MVVKSWMVMEQL